MAGKKNPALTHCFEYCINISQQVEKSSYKIAIATLLHLETNIYTNGITNLWCDIIRFSNPDKEAMSERIRLLLPSQSIGRSHQVLFTD